MTRTRQSLEMYDGVYISIYIYIYKTSRQYTIFFYLGVARRRSTLGAQRSALLVAWPRSPLGVARRSGSLAARRRSAPLGVARRRSASLGVARREGFHDEPPDALVIP